MSMRAKFTRWVAWAAAACIGLAAAPVQARESSCVTCHLDEAKLVASLTVVKGKKSAMQSGVG